MKRLRKTYAEAFVERRKEKKMTFSYFVSVSGGEPENMEGQKDMESQEIWGRLGRQLIEKGVGGTIIDF